MQALVTMKKEPEKLYDPSEKELNKAKARLKKIREQYLDIPPEIGIIYPEKEMQSIKEAVKDIREKMTARKDHLK